MWLPEILYLKDTHYLNYGMNDWYYLWKIVLQANESKFLIFVNVSQVSIVKFLFEIIAH